MTYQEDTDAAIQKIKLDLQKHKKLTYKTLCVLCPDAIQKSGRVDEDKLPAGVKVYWFNSPDRLKFQGKKRKK